MRIAFGIVMAIDAGLKWSPSFSDHFATYLTDAAQGQPEHLKAWIALWVEIVHVNPPLFAHIVAITETLVAIGLVLGVFSAIVDLAGALLMLLIWSTAEGFGGPYNSGSTDIGAAIIYVVLFAALFFSRAGLYLGLDGILSRGRRHGVARQPRRQLARTKWSTVHHTLHLRRGTARELAPRLDGRRSVSYGVNVEISESRRQS